MTEAPVTSRPAPAAATGADARPRPAAATTTPRARRTRALAPVVVEHVGGADRKANAAIERVLRRRFVGSEGGARDAGYAATIRVDVDSEGSAVTVRCDAALARLPGRNVVGSLKARADVEGDGASPGELAEDAANACAEALADDVAGWVARHH